MQPKTYYAEDHHIRHELLAPEALFVATKLQQAGHTAYLVGGGVRDLLLRREPKDFDISTSARPEQVKKCFRNCLLIGRRFRLAHVRFGQTIIEVSTFRAGDVEDDRLIVRDNIWGTPEQDVLRRDFTVNGLFYDPSDHRIIDYVGGFEDITANLLRSIGEPEVRFRQDPVRMLRCLKFRARFSFDIDSQILPAISQCRSEILKSSPARVVEEMLRMLESGAAEPFFRLLEEHEFLKFFFPFLAGGRHKRLREEVYNYLCMADQRILSRGDRRPLDRAVLVSCLFFPLVEQEIHKLTAQLERAPHLGEIHASIQTLLHDNLVQGFLHFSHRLRATTAYILETQYRLTPISNRKVRSSRLVEQTDFPLAVQLLKLRSMVDTDLNDTFLKWKSITPPYRPPARSPAPRRRRRPRR